MEVLEQNAKALDELVESKDLAENQLDSNMEIVEPTEEVNIDDEKPLVDIWNWNHLFWAMHPTTYT